MDQGGGKSGWSWKRDLRCMTDASRSSTTPNLLGCQVLASPRTLKLFLADTKNIPIVPRVDTPHGDV